MSADHADMTSCKNPSQPAVAVNIVIIAVRSMYEAS